MTSRLSDVTKIGIVVPTLFDRPEYLKLCLASIREAGSAHILLMGPQIYERRSDILSMVDQILEEPPTGNLPSKITYALNCLPSDCIYVSWLGDDDKLKPDSLRLTSRMLDTTDSALVFGGCEYIDEKGNQIGLNRSGPWAMSLARLGPFLAPQPGSLMRRSEFDKIGGLDSHFALAFDYDLFLRLGKEGKIKHLSAILASFRWHGDSLSVKSRKQSSREASMVRIKNSQGSLAVLVTVLNPVISSLTLLAGSIVGFIKARFRRKA